MGAATIEPSHRTASSEAATLAIVDRTVCAVANGPQFSDSLSGIRILIEAIDRNQIDRRPVTCHGSRILFYKLYSALCDSAASIVERPYHHSVVFGKSGKHRANTLAAPAGFRGGHPVPMQNITSPIKTKIPMAIETYLILHVSYRHSLRPATTLEQVHAIQGLSG